MLNKDLIKHLADLSRLKLTTKEETKFTKDLQKVLNHFKELKEVETEQIKPMTGGHDLKNVFRDDKIDFSEKAKATNEAGRVIEAFPNEEKGYIKVPKIL